MEKVCILTTVHPRRDTRVFGKEARSLAKRYDVLLLTADGLPEEHIDGVTIRSVVPEKPKNRPERMFCTTKIMYRQALAENAAVYHFHDVELLPIGLRLRRHGKTVIYDVHEDVAPNILDRDYLPRPVLKLAAKLVDRFDKLSAHRLDAIVTVTPYLKKKYEDAGCRTIMVCNFPVLDQFGPDDGKRETCMVYAGARNDYSRGVYQMAETAQDTDVPLRIYGRMPEEDRIALEKIDQKHLVTICGTVPHEELCEALEHSLIGMVTEHATGNAVNAYCIKMFEYMAAGMAVLSTDIPLWRSIVEETGCGLCVDPRNRQAMAEAVRYLAEHPDEARRMGGNGRRAALEEYNWSSEEKKLLSLYEELTQ